MTARKTTIVIAGVAILTAGACSLANDTALTMGGTPRPLAGHPTVAMKSELIRMVVGEKECVVDCSFTFENRGPACKVRVGFPDQGTGEDAEDNGGRVPKGRFTSFKSWVNAKPVKTTVTRGVSYGNLWHVKDVRFPANSLTAVRDLYTTPVGTTVGYGSPMMLASYILHTGASWNGPIGRSEVIVRFNRRGVGSPLIAKRTRWSSETATTVSMPNYAGERKADRRIVYYDGPAAPIVSGKTLRFVRNNWRPTKEDDIHLVFELAPRKAD